MDVLPEWVIGLGAVISLSFAHVPKLKDWYAGQDSSKKQLINAGVMLLAGVVLWAASCNDVAFLAGKVTCSENALADLWAVVWQIAVGNIGAYVTLGKVGK